MRNRLVRMIAPVGVALLLVGSATACSGGGTQAPAGSDNFAAKAAFNPHPVSDLKPGGNVTWPISQWIANWNYNQTDGTTVDMGQMRQALFPTPVKAAEDGSLSADTRYFTSIADSTVDGKFTVTYDINPKATWSNGRPLDWTDLEAQWKALNGTNKEFQAASTTGYDQIEAVRRGTTDKQVIVTYTKPFADWLAAFGPLYPREVNSTPEAFNTGFAATAPPTAGPFRIRSVDSTAKRVVAERNPNWWGERPVLDTITYVALDGSASIGALQNGEIDFYDLGSQIDGFKTARSMPNVEIRQSLGFQWRHLDFNGSPGRVTADKAVRLAVMRAVNRDLIANALLGPITSKPTVLNNHIYVTGYKGYQPNNGDITFDPDRARRELDAAGWKLEGQFRKKDGKQLDIAITIPASQSNATQEAQLIQQNLRDVGINLTIDAKPGDDFFPKFVLRGNYDVTLFTWEGTQTPASSSLGIYELRPGATLQNYGQVGNDAINSLIAKVKEETDPAKQIELLNQLDALIWQEGHSLPLYQRPYSFATKKNLANFGAPGFGDFTIEKIGWLK